MRAGIYSVFASGKICKAVLLGLVTIAMVIPRGDIALSQSSTGSQAPSFTAIDLTPSGFDVTFAFGASNGQQVGYGSGPATGNNEHALMWSGSAGSVVDLHPNGFTWSEALGTDGAGSQVGSGAPTGVNFQHAILWSGSGVVDLNPNGFQSSLATGTSSGQQVGWGWTAPYGYGPHALLWSGSAASVVDLNTSGTLASYAYGVSGGQQVGAGGPSGNAVLWNGTAASAVDLHPSGFSSSVAYGISRGQQVGEGDGQALLWSGSASSVVDLHPVGFITSTATGTNGQEQVGWGVPYYGNRFTGPFHALLWRGSASSVVDLHTFLPSSFTDSKATGIDSNGNIVGYAYVNPTGNYATGFHAFLWRENAVPVLLLPGVPGSWTQSLRNAFANGGVINIPALDFVSMFFTHLPYTQMAVDPVYDDLINTLRSQGIPVFAMPYDWANGGYEGAAADLDQFMRDHNFDKVDIIAHSAGGLVAQQYIQNHISASTDPHVRNLILLGSINEGTLVAHCAYYVDPVACISVDKEHKLLLDTLFQVLESTKLGKALGFTALELAQNTGTVAEAMPIFPYLQLGPLPSLFTSYSNAYLQGLHNQTLSEISTKQLQSARITPYTVHGTGVPTPGIFVVRSTPEPLRPYRVLPESTVFNDGDGSTLAGSAVLSGVNDVPVPNATHLEGLLNCVKEAYPRLRNTGILACSPQVRPASTYVEVQTLSPVRIQLTDPQGRFTGTDFATGTDVAGIPTSTFFESDHPGIFVGDAIQGTYTLDVLGIGSGGTFELDIAFPNAFPNDFDITIKSFSGSIAPGQTLGFTFDTFAFQGLTNLFAAFGANLAISPSFQAFGGDGTFTLGSGGMISPVTEPVTIQIGNSFLATIPAGSFERTSQGTYVFGGVIQGVLLAAALTPTGGNSYAFAIGGAGVPNLPSANPVDLRLAIGSNGGSTSMTASFVP